MFYIASEQSLVHGHVADDTLEAKVRQRWAAIVLNIVAIAIALVLPLVAVGLYLVVSWGLDARHPASRWALATSAVTD